MCHKGGHQWLFAPRRPAGLPPAPHRQTDIGCPSITQFKQSQLGSNNFDPNISQWRSTVNLTLFIIPAKAESKFEDSAGSKSEEREAPLQHARYSRTMSLKSANCPVFYYISIHGLPSSRMSDPIAYNQGLINLFAKFPNVWTCPSEGNGLARKALSCSNFTYVCQRILESIPGSKKWRVAIRRVNSRSRKLE